jgi:DNA-binding NtrC family response regulator
VAISAFPPNFQLLCQLLAEKISVAYHALLHPQPEQRWTPCSLAAAERNHILSILRFTKGNKRKAARLLGITPATLYRKLEQNLGGSSDEFPLTSN